LAIDIRRYLPSDAEAAMSRAVTPDTASLSASAILGMNAEVRRLRAAGQTVANFTIGDFAPGQFGVPEALADGITAAVAAGHTHYPPADGTPGLRRAIADLYARDLGIDYGMEGVCVGSGARPPLFCCWRAFVEPGDRTVSALPMWNVSYYARLFKADHHFIQTTAATNFFPTVDQVADAIRGARLLLLNSPLNPTGTVISEDVMRGIAQALVRENASRERPCMLAFDQVYWKLVGDGFRHHNPVALVPECAPYVVHIDAISKWMAGTGLRVGWAVLPPYIQGKMRALIGHIGAWAPHPEQVATAALLDDPAALDAYLGRLHAGIQARLKPLYDGIVDMCDRGLPVDAIQPQGGIYQTLKIDLIGRGFDTNEDIRAWLLRDAGVAVVPFQAFDMPGNDGWFRMAISAVSPQEVHGALERLEGLLSAV